MKLTKTEKFDYKYFKMDFKSRGGFFVEGHRTTMACMLVGDYWHVAVAVCGVSDKHNAKRGRYEAMEKFNTYRYIPVPVHGDFVLGDINLADIDIAYTAAQAELKAK